MPLTEHGRDVVARQGRNPEIKPRDDKDWSFVRDVACELVFAWRDAEFRETRRALERVMNNVGLDYDLEDGLWYLKTPTGTIWIH